jgi:hypothetical protein
MYWCQIEGICVADLTQCYFPGAIGPTNWEACTVDPLVSKTPTCRFVHLLSTDIWLFNSAAALADIRAIFRTPLQTVEPNGAQNLQGAAPNR